MQITFNSNQKSTQPFAAVNRRTKKSSKPDRSQKELEKVVMELRAKVLRLSPKKIESFFVFYDSIIAEMEDVLLRDWFTDLGKCLRKEVAKNAN